MGTAILIACQIFDAVDESQHAPEANIDLKCSEQSGQILDAYHPICAFELSDDIRRLHIIRADQLLHLVKYFLLHQLRWKGIILRKHCTSCHAVS